MPTTAIPAIPTRYLGYSFRSRLEARWCVFFEALKIKYHYELEGIILLDGTRYLPDFFLPDVKLWAEVKPVELTPAEHSKCKQLMRCTDLNCLFLVGPPDFTTYMGTTWDCDDYSETDYLLDIDWHGRRYYKEGRFYACTDGSWNHRSMFTEQYQQAIYAARSARFDEGGA